MEIICNTTQRFINLTITMTEEDVKKNLILYNGEKLNGLFKISSNSFNFNIQISSRENNENGKY
jgi:hypothetical protein